MSTEFGIFNDEGCIEGEFYSREDADRAMADRYAEDDAHVAEVCPDHRDQERDHCEHCRDAADDEEASEDPDHHNNEDEECDG